MDQNFHNNLAALQQQNPELADKLAHISTNEHFEAFQSGPQPIEINIFDKQRQVNLYENPLNELSLGLERMDEQINYHFLYFFGIGNGYLIKSILLRHTKLKRFVIIEPELELLYIALHLNDFSFDLYSGRLKIYHIGQSKRELFEDLFVEGQSALYSKSTTLYPLEYYITYYEREYLAVFMTFQNTLNHILNSLGNSLEDQFTGIKQTLEHLHLIQKSPSLRELKRKKNSDLVIIVSTGPSLSKQLPLLKQIAPYVTLISVDASLPILELHGIKPDICASVERDEPTSEFFKRTSSEFRKGIIFVCPFLQHPSVFSALADDIVVPVFRPSWSQRVIGDDNYGYIGAGHSAANLAHNLAYEMGYKRCVLIGQDLSFASDGETTHAQGHIFESDPDIAREVENGNLFEIPAYGGNGSVKTHVFWKLFRDDFVKSSLLYTDVMQTINATEGGARIEGTIEIPFCEVAATVLTTYLPKPQITLVSPPRKETDAILHKIDKRVQTLLVEGRRTLKRIIPLYEQLNALSCELSPLNKKELSVEINLIHAEREKMSSNQLFDQFYLPILISSYFEDELNIVEVSQQKFSDEMSHDIAFICANTSLFKKIIQGTQHIIALLETKENV